MISKKIAGSLFALSFLASCSTSNPSVGDTTEQSSSQQSSSIAAASSSAATSQSSEAKSSTAGNGAAYRDGVQLPTVLSNGGGYVVYRYSIAAPATKAVTVTGESFHVQGARWDHPQLKIYADPNYSQQIMVWDSKDNWTEGEALNFVGKLVIPPGETRYLEAGLSVSTPAECPTLQIRHEGLSELRVVSSEEVCSSGGLNN